MRVSRTWAAERLLEWRNALELVVGERGVDRAAREALLRALTLHGPCGANTLGDGGGGFARISAL